MTTYQQPTTISIPDATYTDEAFDSFEMDFAEGEQADKPITEEARLWWFNGLPTDTDTMAIGCTSRLVSIPPLTRRWRVWEDVSIWYSISDLIKMARPNP